MTPSGVAAWSIQAVGSASARRRASGAGSNMAAPSASAAGVGARCSTTLSGRPRRATRSQGPPGWCGSWLPGIRCQRTGAQARMRSIAWPSVRSSALAQS